MNGVGDDEDTPEGCAGHDQEPAAKKEHQANLFDGLEGGLPEHGYGNGDEIEIGGDVHGPVHPYDLVRYGGLADFCRGC